MYAIDAREKAPMSAYSTMFVNSTKSSLKGAHSLKYHRLKGVEVSVCLNFAGGSATGIPGELYGYYVAHKLGGKLPWKELFEPAITLCTNGYYVSKALDKILKTLESSVKKTPALADLFVNPLTEKPYVLGDRIRRPQLAKTLRFIAENGAESFYNGKLTRIMVEEINKNGGFDELKQLGKRNKFSLFFSTSSGGDVRVSDFKEYRAIAKKPIEVKFDSKLRAFTIPPPSSGFLTAFAIRLMSCKWAQFLKHVLCCILKAWPVLKLTAT